MHDSGTRRSPSFGNFALFSYVGCTDDDIDGCAYPKKARKVPFVNSSLKTSPGYFVLELANGVTVDMTIS